MLRQLQTKLLLALAGGLFGAVLITLIIVFACMAIYLALCDAMPPAMAALSTAAAAIVALIIILLVIKLIGAATRSRRPAAPRSEFPMDLLLNLGKQFGSQSGRNPTLTLLGMLAIGFALGASPRLRGLLLRLL